MKNSILLIATGLILLTGCSKDESIEQVEEQSKDVIYVSTQNNGNNIWETMEIDLNNSNPYSNTTDTRGYGYTNGLYNPPNRNPLLISWSGTRDESGSSGSAEIQMTTPDYSFHFLMETECITVIDNTAMYGGIITEVIEVSGNPPPFDLNWRFYFKIIDGFNSGERSVDKISSFRIFSSPRSMSLCNEYPPNHPIWSTNGYEEVLEPGFVVVDDYGLD